MTEFYHYKTGEKILAIAVHLKAGGSERSIALRKIQYDKMVTIVDELKASYKNIVMMGDFNTVDYEKESQERKNFNSMIKSRSLKEFLIELSVLFI